jgi:hypothetical protein
MGKFWIGLLAGIALTLIFNAAFPGGWGAGVYRIEGFVKTNTP